jgi:hypothetical protein
MSKDDSELAEDHDFYPPKAQRIADKHFERLETFKPTEAMLQQMRGWLGVFGDDIVAEAKGLGDYDYLEHALADTFVQSPWVRIIEAAQVMRDDLQYLVDQDLVDWPEFDGISAALSEAGL